MYRGDYSAKILLGFRNFQLLAGPNIMNRFFTGVKIGGSENYRAAGDQFAAIVIGVEAGAGVKLGDFLLSGKYRGNITEFGRETPLLPTKFRNYQIRFQLAYFIHEKHRAKHHDSIFWD